MLINTSVQKCKSLMKPDQVVVPDIARMVISALGWQTLASAQ